MMQRNLADRFASLWDGAHASPDVVVFLGKHRASTLEDKISVLLVDQERCWQTGKPISVEQYLEQFPDLATNDNAVLDLVLGEYRARKASGNAVSVDDLISRFSHISESIQSRLSEYPTSAIRQIAEGWPESLRTTEIYCGTKSNERIGRYRLVRLLGEGGYGRVWLAFDEDLERPVAVKIPTARRFQRIEDAEAYLSEARTVATLDHPNIVPVHDVGRTSEGSVYIVSKYIEGHDLAARIKESPPRWEESAEIIASIAKALHHAHKRHLIHRDVKPRNILIEEASQQPYLADFGLAIREEDYLREGGIAGTPSYMSPEQARGEGHRLSGCSDIFSLGTVLYVLLTGKNPFQDSSRDRILHNVISIEPTPPQELNEEIPSELQRICLKAMSKRASDRYVTALEFADDLQHWLAEPEKKSARDIAVVPKGLRSFDAEDANFFLELLPGPRNRDGLPEAIRFWKTRIEETDPDNTFAVGLLYGPSGCGKSSMMKAGVLPCVSNDIIKVYIEATPEQTETRLLRGLRKQVPNLSEDIGLVESFAILRRGSERKVVVVLDQFEQWLHVKRNEPDSELVGALRQCDGRRLQAICLVRDDFAMAAARFMGELDVPILQGHNFATVDLFDVDHARKVLAKFGQAFGKISDHLAGQPDHQDPFLTAVASGLARDNKVVSVRLALFAEMIKDKPWTLSTLEEVGGTEGIGFNFLEDTFTSRVANPKHRLHQKAARSVLRLLLPEAGTNIKGYMRSHEELLDVSGYSERERDFGELLGILDGELRLITPTDPEGMGTESGKDTGSKYYQLTHDYLVPPLREWLTHKQKETRKGRAELRLEELAGHWNSKPETRHLPSLWEWVRIRTLTEKKRWTDPQREMMRVAARVRGIGWTVSLLVVIAVVAAFQWYISSRQADDERKRAKLLVDALFTAPAEAVPYAIQNLRPLHSYAVPMLQERFENEGDSARRLRAAVALAEYGQVHLDFLLTSISSAARRECSNIVTAVGNVHDVAINELQVRANEADAKQQWNLKARLAIVALHLGDRTIAQDMFRKRPDPVQRTVLIDTIPTWHGAVDQWIESSAAFDNADFWSGICLGVGSVAPEDLSVNERRNWERILQDWYQQQPDGVIHSATGWALRQWNSPLPVIAPSRQQIDGRDWYVNSAGMAMLRIPAGSFERQTTESNESLAVEGRDQTVTLTRSSWFSDHEVSRAQFQQFIDDLHDSISQKPTDWEGAKLTRSPTVNHPVQQVSWIDAVLFCNWLSRKEKLTPCYEGSGPDWELILEADGYRLPFEAEWEYACRAGTTTSFASGNDDSQLAKYAVFLSNSTEICGSKMPNAWGLFDTHGNVFEWCQDRYDDYAGDDSLVNPQGPIQGSDRVLRGGAFDYGSIRAHATHRAKNRPSYRSFTVGFRVVRNNISPDSNNPAEQ